MSMTEEQLAHFRANVPCAGCRACCKNEFVGLFPSLGDDVSQYEIQSVTDVNGITVCTLKQKPNGDCIYLGDDGCTIHNHAPAMCRIFDCRRLYKEKSRKERRRLIATGEFSSDVFKAGRDRLHTLEAAE